MNNFQLKQKYLTIVGPIEVLSAAQLGDRIQIEQVSPKEMKLISQNTARVVSSVFDEDLTTYETRKIVAVPFDYSRIRSFIASQIRSLAFEHSSVDLTLASNFDEVLERAAIAAMENFGDPTHACVLSGNKLFLADINGDAMRFFFCEKDGETLGALVSIVPTRQIVANFGSAAAMGHFVGKMGLR